MSQSLLMSDFQAPTHWQAPTHRQDLTLQLISKLQFIDKLWLNSKLRLGDLQLQLGDNLEFILFYKDPPKKME